MKTIISKLVFLACGCMLVSCSNSRFQDDMSNRDEMSSFLATESLAINDFRVTTNECGYEVNLKLTDKSDSNRVFQGWMMLSDLEKEKREAARRNISTKEAEEREGNESKNGTNQFVATSIFNKSAQGYIRDAHLLNSERIKQRFPDCQIFSVFCLSLELNPIYIAQPLVIGTNYNHVAHSTIFILGNAATVATFISQHKKPVHNRDEARETLDLLCELQSWTICESMPVIVKSCEETEKPEWVSRWIYKETSTKTGWNFRAVFLTDPEIQSYSYYEIDVFFDGTISIKDRAFMRNFRGGYK